MEVQVDFLVTEFDRFKCDRAALTFLRKLGLHRDRPGEKRRLPKFRYFDANGKQLQNPTQIINCDVLYNLGEPLQRMKETEFPELMRNTCSLYFWANDEGV
jgi:hypothetical protein